MIWELKLPIRDPDERVSVKAASELPRYLADPDEQIVCRELLQFALDIGHKAGGMLPVGTLAEMVEHDFTAEQRKGLLGYLRRRAGLESIEDVEARTNAERATQAGLRKQAHDTRPLRLAFSPSGAIIDLNEADDEAARERARAASAAARKEHRRIEAEAAEPQRRADESRPRRAGPCRTSRPP